MTIATHRFFNGGLSDESRANNDVTRSKTVSIRKNDFTFMPWAGPFWIICIICLALAFATGCSGGHGQELIDQINMAPGQAKDCSFATSTPMTVGILLDHDVSGGKIFELRRIDAGEKNILEGLDNLLLEMPATGPACRVNLSKIIIESRG